ncbi:MAG: glycerol-3-phosphate dehydrogenase [Candidatus Bipolaricaulia bacterium]
MGLAEELYGEEFDLAVIGGGITGAGVARDATIRGLDVVLFEKDDFAQGTSSSSTKLIHGGLRYLENYEFGLVREALREREILLNIASHLVYPSKFFFPVYKESRIFPLQLRAGLVIYDLLGWGKRMGRHNFIDPEETKRTFPELKRKGLKSTGVYYDCQTDDARLALSNVLDAASRGASVANYAEVTDLVRSGNEEGWNLTVNDKLEGDQFAIKAKKVVNATGPWSDDIARNWRTEEKQFLRPTKGVHLIFPALETDVSGFFPSIHDDRLFFVIPWEGKTLVGTTDTDFSGSPDDLTVDSSDREYLISNVNHYLDEVEFEEDDVLAEFAGLRPLYSTSKGQIEESKISRDHEIIVERDSIFTIIGGKYTTYRAMAEETLDIMGTGKSSSTAQKKLSGAWEEEEQKEALKARILGNYDLTEIQVDELLHRYGRNAQVVLESTSQFPDFDVPVGDGEIPIGAQIYYSVTKELARKPDDIVRRRTGLFMEEGTARKKVVKMMKRVDDQEVKLSRG